MFYRSDVPVFKTKKAKCGRENSEYALWVLFYPQFQFPHRTFTYWSDPPYGNVTLEMQKQNLIRRVLQGSCKGRYKLAQLYQNGVERHMQEWKGNAVSEGGLNLYIVLQDEYAQQMKKAKRPHPFSIKGMDVCTESGITGEDIALRNYRRILTGNSLEGKVKFANVYRPGERGKVFARFDAKGQLTMLDPAFKEMILQKQNISPFEMGMFDQY